MHHIAQYRVYYEDTDAAGIVYYANYLKFAERARTDWLREQGISQREMMQATGIGLVVRHVEADFRAPARLDDIIVIESRLQEAGKVRMKMQQILKCGPATLVVVDVTIVAVGRNGKPVRLPEGILKKLEN